MLAKQNGLVDEEGSKQALALADAAREDCLTKRIDFSFETAMSHESKPQFMKRAFDAGFEVTLYFVGTGDPQINVNRVHSRVQRSGHAVPEDRIVKRYFRSIELLLQAMISAHKTVIFDNRQNGDFHWTGTLRPVIESKFSDATLIVEFYPPVPVWASEALRFSTLGYRKIPTNDESFGTSHSWIFVNPDLGVQKPTKW